MILIDANLLLYAKVQDYPQHAKTRAWLDERLNQPARVGLPWPSLLAFLRIATNVRVFSSPLSIDEAWDQVSQWLAIPQVWIPQPTDRHAKVVEELLQDGGVVGGLVMDAHLAALAREHGLQLCSADSDFARFPGLSWFNPLEKD